jgi:hypothetical protein
MDAEDIQNGFIRYTDVIKKAFDFYENKINNEIKNEQQNNNNVTLISHFETVKDLLNAVYSYFTKNISLILQSGGDPNRFDNIVLFNSVLSIYDRDLDRCIDLLQKTYQLEFVGSGSIQEESSLIKEIIEIINPKK